ncbi:Uncharacterised protein [Mycobacteroides abscessus subsp. abscessus]|nr:Uncharacterised protein [Mycobacteroides abscessus subsp. abscessus]
MASRECVHGTQVSVALIFGMPLSSRASGAAGPSGPASAGACQAPHTTASRRAPPLSALRIACRM